MSFTSSKRLSRIVASYGVSLNAASAIIFSLSIGLAVAARPI